MDDLSEKLAQLFSNPESMEKIKTIAGSFLSDSGNKEKEETSSVEKNEDNNSAPASAAPSSGGFGLPGLDPQMLLKITSFLSKANADDDDKLKLLYSIKPYLSEKRAEKIDSAAQILKMSKYASVFAKDMDLFNKKK